MIRLASKSPVAIEGTTQIERGLAAVSHAALYGLIAFLPISGIAMGYFGPFGLPFFFTTIPPSATKRPDITKPAYEWHKKAGVLLEYMIPLHVAGAVVHFARGHTIFSRILNIFSK